MNSRTVTPVASAPPFRSSSRFSSSRFFSACLRVFASTLW